MMSFEPYWLLSVATDAPVLPDPAWMRASMALCWAVVLSFLGAALMSGRALAARRVLAALLALWALLPGTFSVTYWLGLAFHAPSITTVLVCALCLKQRLWPATPAVPRLPAVLRWHYGWVGAGVVLGYLLLLDTFALLPVQLYAWGFSTVAVLVALAAALLPWLVLGQAASRSGMASWLLPSVVLTFVLCRLPTGNLWDALLDPWLWVGLQWALWRAAWRRFRAS